MDSVFRKDDNYVDKPRRNVFDLSCHNNLTTNFGKIVPVLMQEVLPGDSFKIKPKFALKFLPQVFPVQTRQRASIKYYYVRNRNLWKDWPDFIGKTKSGLTPPYLQFNHGYQPVLKVGSLLDYMGIPVMVNAGNVSSIKAQNLHINYPQMYENVAYRAGSLIDGGITDGYVAMSVPDFEMGVYTLPNPSTYPSLAQNRCWKLSDVYGGNYPFNKALGISGIDELLTERSMSLPNTWQRNIPYKVGIFNSPIKTKGSFTIRHAGRVGVILRSTSGVDVIYVSDGGSGSSANTIDLKTLAVRQFNGVIGGELSVTTSSLVVDSIVGFVEFQGSQMMEFSLSVDASQNPLLTWGDVAPEHLPFANDANPDGIRISSLPIRAYESIYNALIRNAENNPFLVDGVPEYNKYLENVEGGAENPFKCYYKLANWADDRFTTSLPSPQQGNAPLVGLTGVQGATLTTSSEDGTTTQLHLQVDSDSGNVVLVDQIGTTDEAKQLSSALMSAVDYGITINDLRNVNSFQKWLENNIRRGYKYKDQLMSHYGVTARYDVLDMPEFIGGVSRDIECVQVTQTTENEFGNLGDFAGQSFVSDEGHAIEHYCDEHGFIIGLLTVTPMPIYQNMMPKYFLKNDALDYYFPEFGKIGPQAITCKELEFGKAFLADKMDKAFGYQRAWYDYLERPDEVHGLFRTDFRNFILARDFATIPELGSEFLTMAPDSLNNTFYVDDLSDKILGQIIHNITAKRPIPMIGIPSIE